MTRVVIAGAGIAGLAIANELRRQVPDAEVIVLEASDRIGGNIRSERVDGYLCEWGPDGFLDNAPATLDLVHEIGLDNQVLRSRDAARRRYIFRNQRLHEVPLFPAAFLRSRLLSIPGKLRLAAEPFAAARPARDESIHGFAERRIGRQAADIMVESMVSGIFAGNAHELSLRACFPKMWDMESEYGSLVRALIAKRRQRRPEDGIGSPAGTLTSFVNGMEELPRAIAASLGPRVSTNSPVVALRQRARVAPNELRPVGARAYTILTSDRSIEADAVVLAGSSANSADLVRPFDSTLASLLGHIESAPLAVVCLGYDDAALVRDRGPLNGFGFLAPRREGIRILGALWETSIYERRAPAGKALIRVMIGGATDRDAVEMSDSELVWTVRSDLLRAMNLRIGPEFVRVIRHRRGIPQYTIGHLGRLSRIDGLLKEHPGLFLAGNSYRGVAINSCIAEAPAVATMVAGHLRAVAAADRYAVAR